MIRNNSELCQLKTNIKAAQKKVREAIETSTLEKEKLYNYYQQRFFECQKRGLVQIQQNCASIAYSSWYLKADCSIVFKIIREDVWVHLKDSSTRMAPRTFLKGLTKRDPKVAKYFEEVCRIIYG